MIIIRLSRSGRKGKPFYHVVVADNRCKRDGRRLEKIGYYNPIANKVTDQVIEINQERVDYWVSQGAQIKDRVKTLLKRQRKLAESRA